MAEKILLDFRGKSCPIPALATAKNLEDVASGIRIEVLADDSASLKDIPAVVKNMGHHLEDTIEEEGSWRFVIRTNGDVESPDVEAYAQELKFYSKKLEGYSDQLESTIALKDLFVDILRHDFLNYVNNIKLLSEILSDVDADEAKNVLERIWGNAMKMEDMIECATKLSKVEEEGDICFIDQDLNVIMKGVLESLEPIIKEKDMHIEFLASEEAIAWSSKIVEDIFINLVSNAIKYSPAGTAVTIAILNEGDSWKVMVADKGEGVADNVKEAIFDRFNRGGKVGIKGSGLGLAIVKRVVDIHQGKVWVEDNPGGGSIFFVTLPKKPNAG